MLTVIMILLGIAVLLLLDGILENYFPTTKEYHIQSEKIKKDKTAVLLTDLHACCRGRKKDKYVQMIQRQNPDILLIAGDMTVKNGTHTESVTAFLKEIVSVAPIFYAPGNHEIRMPEYESFIRAVQNLGIHYLSNATEKMDEMDIYGLDLPEYWYHKFWEKRDFSKEEVEKLLGSPKKDTFSILIAHNPEYFPYYAAWGADLTVSGHIHGGIMRLPRIGGVISPSLRLFPKYDSGEFEENGKKMILSRGMGLHHIKLRFFNRPEISVIKITCQDKSK